MTSLARRLSARASLSLAAGALRLWGPRRWAVAALAAVVVAVVVGLATVLIPNPVFGRDVEPVWWNYPVWLVTSALTGMFIATYVRGADAADPALTERDSERTSSVGIAGTVIAWFAVGCPVCNKLALLLLGYSGALTWFAPLQPFLALAALALTGTALVARLRGEIACSIPVAAPQVHA